MTQRRFVSAPLDWLVRAASVRVDIARAFERDVLVEARCPQCGSQLDRYRWRREGDRHHCTSCTGTSGVAHLDEHAPRAHERLAIPGLLSIVRDQACAFLEVDRAAFIAGTGDLVLAAEHLEHAAAAVDVNVRRRVVKHPAVTPSILERLARDADASLREDVAAHAKTPVSALAVLAEDADDEVRLRVARHPDTPAALLVAMVRTATPKLRVALASHAMTPLPVLLELFEDADKPVLMALAARDARHDELTQKLKKHGYSLKQPKPDPFGAAWDPESGVTREEWERSIADSHRH